MLNLVLGYAAGVLTLVNPCVLPVLPIVLATALQAGRWGPVALASGMSLAFVTLGLGVAAAGRSLGLTEDAVARGAALLMAGFGLVLLVPRVNAGFAMATAGLSARADLGISRIGRAGTADQLPGGQIPGDPFPGDPFPGGQFLAGMLLGAVWSPCVGPTLGGAISLASQGSNLGQAGLVMLAFALGVSTVILSLGYGARSALRQRQAMLRRLAENAKPILGWTFLAVGLALFFRLHHLAEAWLIARLPVWMLDLSVSI